LIVQLLKDPTAEIKINSSEEEKTTNKEEQKKSFVSDKKLQSFAQQNFLDFDDDDD